MSSENTGSPSSYSPPPAYPESDMTPTASPVYITGAPEPAYTGTGNRAGAYQPKTFQYGVDYDTQYGQQANVQVVQTQPAMMIMRRNKAAGETYSGLCICSIIITLLCFCPIGIFAMHRAQQAMTAAEMGRSVEAERHADAAKKFMIASVVVAIIVIGLSVFFTMI